MTDTTLINQIRALDKLTPSETKIADYICSQYPEVAFENVTSISQKADVSKATVVRFIQRLGYDGFAQFHQKVRADMMQEYTSPEQRFTLMKENLLVDDQDILGQNLSFIMKNLRQAHAKINRATFERMARRVADPDRNLYVIGQRTSFGLAYMFYTLVGYFRPKTTLLDMQAAMLPDVLADIGETDMLFAISFRRYARITTRVARHFSERGASVMALADSEFSPLNELAQLQLVVPADGLAMFRSRCAATALLESLAIAALQYSGRSTKDRSKILEALFSDFQVYTPK